MFFCDAHGRVRLAQRPKACRLRGDERNILWVIKIWIENTPHSLQSCFYHALLDVLFEYVALIIRKSAFFFYCYSKPANLYTKNSFFHGLRGVNKYCLATQLPVALHIFLLIDLNAFFVPPH